MADAFIKAEALALVLVICAAIVWVVVKKRKGGKAGVAERNAGHFASEFYKAFGRSALLEYTPVNRFENATIAAATHFLNSGKNVVLVTQPPRSRMYIERFHGFVEKGDLKIVNLTTENPLARPQMFRITPNLNENEAATKETDFVSVSINNLEFLTEIVEQMQWDGVLVFEALTGIILGLGKEKKEAVYKFFSSIVEEMSANQRILIAFLNRSAHEKETISAYEGLFVKILKIEDDSIHSIKGEKIRVGIPIESLLEG